MSDLDKRLEEILGTHHHSGTVNEIKQAFKDAGYAKRWWMPEEGDPPVSAMPGEFWLRRFEHELGKVQGSFVGDDGVLHHHNEAGLIGKSHALEAAKKAAGIE